MKTLLTSLLAAAALAVTTPTLAHGVVDHGAVEVCHDHRSARHCHIIDNGRHYVAGAVVHHEHRRMIRRALRQQRLRRFAHRHHDHHHAHDHRGAPPEVTVVPRRSGGNVTVQRPRGGNVTVVGPTTPRRTRSVTTVTPVAPVIIIQRPAHESEDRYRAVHEGNDL